MHYCQPTGTQPTLSNCTCIITGDQWLLETPIFDPNNTRIASGLYAISLTFSCLVWLRLGYAWQFSAPGPHLSPPSGHWCGEDALLWYDKTGRFLGDPFGVPILLQRCSGLGVIWSHQGWCPLVHVYITMEKHHAIWGWPCSIAMLNYRRVGFSGLIRGDPAEVTPTQMPRRLRRRRRQRLSGQILRFVSGLECWQVARVGCILKFRFIISVGYNPFSSVWIQVSWLAPGGFAYAGCISDASTWLGALPIHLCKYVHHFRCLHSNFWLIKPLMFDPQYLSFVQGLTTCLGHIQTGAHSFCGDHTVVYSFPGCFTIF